MTAAVSKLKQCKTLPGVSMDCAHEVANQGNSEDFILDPDVARLNSAQPSSCLGLYPAGYYT